jgi:prepilin-type N-terminal cleavage/methylation domain-containing protein
MPALNSIPSSLRPHRRGGFTVIELLVVIAIVALVIGFSFPAISSIRNRAAQAREMVAARSLLQAWSSYATEQNGALLPGYRNGLPAFDENRNPIAAQTIGVAAARYPWRLAPYLGYNFRGLYLNENLKTLEALESTDYSNYLYLTSAYPSLGLNATWVGGDENQGGFNASFQQAFGKFYVSRMAEIRRTAQLIVFGSARGIDPMALADGKIEEGYFRVRSPNFTESQWAAAYDPADAASCGQLSSRNGNRTVVGLADGHVEAKQVEELRDMRMWADRADVPDWKLTPQQ